MRTIATFITTSTIIITILLIFIGVEYQLGHHPCFLLQLLMFYSEILVHGPGQVPGTTKGEKM